MELKRTLTKRMRIRRSAAPDSIDLPPNQAAALKQTASKPTVEGPAVGTSGVAAFPSVPPHTPRTPSADEFVSIAFDGVSSASPQSRMTSPSRSIQSGRSSRSASVVSNVNGSQFAGSQYSTSISNASTNTSSPPPLTVNLEKAMDPLHIGSSEPLSPDSVHESDVREADEMAQLILAKVRQGGQQKWSL